MAAMLAVGSTSIPQTDATVPTAAVRMFDFWPAVVHTNDLLCQLFKTRPMWIKKLSSWFSFPKIARRSKSRVPKKQADSLVADAAIVAEPDEP
jgi:hypothetical protein